MVAMDPVTGDVVQLCLREVILSRYNIFAQTDGTGDIGVCGEIAGLVVAGQFQTFDAALRIIERGINQGLAELALVDQVRGNLVEAVNADIQRGSDLLDYARIEIIGPFRQNG